MTGFYKDYADSSDTHQNSAEASADAAESAKLIAQSAASTATTKAIEATTAAGQAAASASQAAASTTGKADLTGADFTGDVTTTGDVGIGINSPEADLHINNTAGSELRIDTTGGSNVDSVLNFRENSVDRASLYWDGADNDLYLETTIGDIALLPTGNVGIGTDDPQQKLDVAGNIQATGTSFISALYDTNNYMRVEANSSGGVLKGTDSGAVTTFVRSYGDSYFNGGNVGIGTTNPSELLEVSSDTGSTSIDPTVVRISTTTSAGTWDNNSLWGALQFYSADASDSGAKTQAQIGANTASTTGGISDLTFSLAEATSGTLTERMRIDASGNVGIGATNPQRELEVSGTGNVYARITAETANDSTALELKNTGQTWQIRNEDTNDDALEFIDSTATRLTIKKDGNVGIGTDDPQSTLHVNGIITATANPVIKKNVPVIEFRSPDGTNGMNIKANLNNTDNYGLQFEDKDGNNRIVIDPAGDVSFYNDTDDTTPKFRWDASTERLGIGTDSPSEALTVSGNIQIEDNDGYLQFKDSNAGVDNKLRRIYNAEQNLYISRRNDDGTLESNDVIIDSSGNVGIGTTSPSSALEVADSGVELRITDTRNQTFTVGDTIASLGFYSNDVSGSSGGANNLPRGAIDVVTTSTFGSTHDMVFRTRGDETADASEKVRITSTGKVGIGTTSPSATLEVNAGSFQAMKLRRGTSGTDANIITFAQGDGTSVGHIGGVGSGGLQLRTGSGNGTERMRIDSSGNVLVGTTTSTVGFNNAIEGVNLRSEGRIFASADQDYPLNLSRNTNDGDIAVFRKDGVPVGSIGTDSNSQLMIGSGDTGLSFQSNNDAIIPRNTSGAARSGLINLGTTGAQFKDLYLSKRVYSGNPSNTAGNLFLHIDGNADGVSTGYKIRSGVGVSTGSYHIAFVNPNGVVGTIQTNGSATSYNTSSDERLKENIQDADDAGSKIDAIQVRQFDWIIDGTHESYGVIAQELQSVAPEAVSGNPESEEMMGVDYSKLVPTLIKEIQTLRNRVAQLENN